MRETPNKSHCAFLRRCPVACREFPQVLGVGDQASRIGEPCPNNPYQKYAAKIAALKREADLLEDAAYYGDLIEVGALPKLDELTPEEFLLARMIKSHRKRQEMKLTLMALTAANPFAGKPEG